MNRVFDTARWIKVVEPELKPKGERPAYWVAKEFQASAGHKVLRISAQGLYQAYLNGERIGNDELTPGLTQYHQRIQFQTYEIQLLEGNNKLEILLADGWFRGAIEMQRNEFEWGDHVAVIAEISGLVATDSTWKSSPSHILGADLMLGQNEDLRLRDSRTWSAMQEIEVSAKLVEPIAPPVRRIENLAPKSIQLLSDGAYVVDFGQNINGWTRITNLGPAGNKVTLTHAEFVGADGNIDTSHLDAFFPMMKEPIYDHQIDSVISAGLDGDVFEPMFTTHGFQYVRVDGVRELQPTEISAVVVHSDLAKIGTFTSSDGRLTWIHEATDWSFRGNACDVPTDCPTRERSGWSGDWQIFVDTAAFMYDIDAWSRKWLADAVMDQNSDGRIANISPTTKGGGFGSPIDSWNGSAGWGDVIVQAPLAAYRAYAKTEALEECFDAMEKWIIYGLKSAETGRHAGRTGPVKPHERYLWDTGFHWGEWLEPDITGFNPFEFPKKDQSEVASAYLYRSTRDFAEICRILAKPQEIADKYQDLADNIKAAWQLEHLDSNGMVKTRRQAALARALQFDLVPTEMRKAVASDLAELIKQNGGTLNTGFLATVYLLPMLAENGQVKAAYDLLLQEQKPSWLYMRNKGATTVWESWNGISEDGTPEMSLNHYSKGAVTSFLHHQVVGLKALRPGYQEFIVEPRFDDRVPDAAVTLETPFGLIASGWRRDGNSIVVEVTCPALASGLIRLPDGREIDVPSGQTATAVF